MLREDNIGLGRVVTTSMTYKDENPLPFLRKLSNKSGSAAAIWLARKKLAAVQWTRSFNKSGERRLILPLGFFYLNFFSFNIAQSPLFFEMCRALVEWAPIGYVLLSSKKLRTTLLVKEKNEVDKILVPIKSS
jgi:hypothetical protein